MVKCYGIYFFRKDDNWKLSRGVYIFVTIGFLLLLGAISAVIVVVTPWTVREDQFVFQFVVLDSIFFRGSWPL